MSTTEPDRTTSDPSRVRLSWPGDTRDAGTGPSPADAEPATEHPEPVTVDPVPPPFTRPSSLVPAAEVDAGGSSALRRAVVEAYDRLAERVLQRLRAVHEDLDADLTEIRSELGTLRQAVDDLGDRVQLRSMRSALDDLRSDVAGLRRAVIEWPELERVSADITALRADMSEVASRLSVPPAESGDQLAAVVDEVRRLSTTLSGLPLAPAPDPRIDAVTSDLSALRRELAALGHAVTDGLRSAQPGPSVTLLAPLVEEIGRLRGDLPAVTGSLAAGAGAGA